MDCSELSASSRGMAKAAIASRQRPKGFLLSLGRLLLRTNFLLPSFPFPCPESSIWGRSGPLPFFPSRGGGGEAPPSPSFPVFLPRFPLFILCGKRVRFLSPPPFVPFPIAQGLSEGGEPTPTSEARVLAHAYGAVRPRAYEPLPELPQLPLHPTDPL